MKHYLQLPKQLVVIEGTGGISGKHQVANLLKKFTEEKPMGKNKKSKRKLRYDKTQFKDIICENCRLCPIDTHFKPDFCYAYYKYNNKIFLRKTHPKLKQIEWPDPPYLQLTIFCNIFCAHCMKDNSGDLDTEYCSDFDKCFNIFKLQIDPIYTDSLNSDLFNKNVLDKKINKKYKKKEKFVVQAYPTFFYSTRDPAWEEEIKETLERIQA